MSKAIEGAAMLGGALLMGVGVFFDPALLASPLFDKAWAALILGGISMEAGALAGALTSNRGTNITTRQAAAFRQIIYGEQRVGGVTIYQSTTGSHHNQYNYVIVLAGHTVDSIVNLYLDGRQVFWNSGYGNTTRNGVNFGGSAASSTHTGPGGQQYNFGGLVYCEARFGDQTAGDVISGLTANDPTWAAGSDGSPWVGGCAYVYLKVEYDTSMFPGAPEIRFTIRGKNNILDPRTGLTGYSTNAALIVADVLTDTQFGLGDAGSVNTAQLIAAANVCDEQVALGAIAGATEARYSLHWHYDTATAPGDALRQMMSAMGGRLSRIGGEWFIWPAYWQGPSFTFDQGTLAEGFQWKPTRAYRELVNRVTGTYIAPNYPYNTAGNLYDANGFYEGSLENNFSYAFQPTNYPQYACDTQHGYSSDQYLNADGNPLPMELAQACVLSISQAQRLAKIALLRNRYQGTGSLTMFLEAYAMQPCDVFQMTMPAMGWSNKVLEVNSVGFAVTEKNKAPVLTVQVGINESDASVYEWSTTEELAITDLPSSPVQQSYTPSAPSSMALISSAATAITGADGVVQPRIEVTWNTPLDGFVTQIQTQFQLVGASAWTDGGLVDVSLNSAYLAPVVAGQIYNVRIRSLRANGAASSWVEIDSFTAALVLSSFGQTAVGVGSLTGEAFSGGAAGIVCGTFTARIGAASVTVLPSGYTITGLAQTQMYWVYYVDPSFAGGAVTPVATQTEADFLGRAGYFLIDSIITPAYTSGGTGSGLRYTPSAYADVGSRTTSTPDAAYDGDINSDARVTGSYTGSGGAYTIGDCIWQGFPSVVLTVAGTLNVSVAILSNGLPCSVTGNGISLVSSTSNVAKTTYTTALGVGTHLDSVTVEAVVDGSAAVGSTNKSGTIEGFEIWVAT